MLTRKPCSSDSHPVLQVGELAHFASCSERSFVLGFPDSKGELSVSLDKVPGATLTAVFLALESMIASFMT